MDFFSMESNHPGLLVGSWEQGKWSQTFLDRPWSPILDPVRFSQDMMEASCVWLDTSFAQLAPKKNGLRELRMMEPATDETGSRIGYVYTSIFCCLNLICRLPPHLY